MSSRIAYLFSRYPVVSHTFCDTEIRGLERRGRDIEIASIHPPTTSFRHAHALEIKAPVYYAPPGALLKELEKAAKRENRWPTDMVREHEEEFGADTKPALRARNALHWAGVLPRRGVGHVHVHFTNRATHTALFIKALSGIPFSFTAHAQDFMVDIGKPLLRELCRQASFAVTVSDYSRELLCEICPEASEKIHRVYNGIDLERFHPVPAAPAVSPLILSVGRFVGFKGFQHLIAACAELKKRDVAFSCEIVGEGPQREDYERAIAELDLSDSVRLPGVLPQEEVAGKLKECAVFALPCDIEETGACDILPTVLLEAMAVGRPVVSTRTAGVPEIVEEGKSGLLVERARPGQLADALAKILGEEALQAGFGREGRRRIEQIFSMDKTSRELIDLFDRYGVAKDAPAPPGPGIAYLVSEWPCPWDPFLGQEITQLRKSGLRLELHVCRHTLASPPDEAGTELLRTAFFLPDGMVLAGEWKLRSEEAGQLEVWRNELNRQLATEDYLVQAKYALRLKREIVHGNIRHVHAIGSQALLCAWMLKRWGGITVSASIESPPELPASTVEALADECLGGRAGSEELAAKLGPAFNVEDRLAWHEAHGQGLGRWLTRITSGDRPPDLDNGRVKEWSETLKGWLAKV